MDKFTEEIKNIFENINENEINTERQAINSDAIATLYSYAEKGVNLLRSGGFSTIYLHRLPFDIVPLFFHFESGGDGFVISTAGKFVFFMQSTEKKIFIYGKDKINGTSSKDKMQQLFNIDFTEDNGKVTYYDSTKKELQAEEIVLLALKWSLN